MVFKKVYAAHKCIIADAWKVSETKRNYEQLTLQLRGNPLCPHVQLEFLIIIMCYFYNLKKTT